LLGSLREIFPIGAEMVLLPAIFNGAFCVTPPVELVASRVAALVLPSVRVPVDPTDSAPGVLTTPSVRLPLTFSTLTFDPLKDNGAANWLPGFGVHEPEVVHVSPITTLPIPPEILAGPVNVNVEPLA
jgi:hypothetical protein